MRFYTHTGRRLQIGSVKLDVDLMDEFVRDPNLKRPMASYEPSRTRVEDLGLQTLEYSNDDGSSGKAILIGEDDIQRLGEKGINPLSALIQGFLKGLYSARDFSDPFKYDYRKEFTLKYKDDTVVGYHAEFEGIQNPIFTVVGRISVTSQQKSIIHEITRETKREELTERVKRIAKHHSPLITFLDNEPMLNSVRKLESKQQ